MTLVSGSFVAWILVRVKSEDPSEKSESCPRELQVHYRTRARSVGQKWGVFVSSLTLLDNLMGAHLDDRTFEVESERETLKDTVVYFPIFSSADLHELSHPFESIRNRSAFMRAPGLEFSDYKKRSRVLIVRVFGELSCFA